MLSDLLNRPDIVPIMVFAIPIVAIVVGCWNDVVTKKSNNALKQAMIDRGMSADEIAQVLDAGRGKRKCK